MKALLGSHGSPEGLESCCRAANVLSHILEGNTACKERVRFRDEGGVRMLCRTEAHKKHTHSHRCTLDDAGPMHTVIHTLYMRLV